AQQDLIIRTTVHQDMADAFSSTTRSNQVADILGARVSSLEGLHHFWAIEDPASAAALLTGFWDRVR
ncbi:MAG TPA: hypothetical protein PK748_05305, partial [Acidimicrobiales bacterium]|nr:hypothetical protein [Acidimicrobiales bacterium]